MGRKERDRLFHFAAGVGDEPLRNRSEKMSTDESLDTRPLPRTGGERYFAAREAFSGVNLGTVDEELKGLYKLAEQRARLMEIGTEQHAFLEKFTAFMGDSERDHMADLSSRLGKLEN